MKNYDLVIIGGGSAGMASAIEAFNNGIKDVLILEKESSLGGILLQCIHTGFGLQEFKEQLSGPEYAYRFEKQVKELGINYKLNTYVLQITKDKDIYYTNPIDGYQVIHAKAIILATGCSERNRGQISIPGDRVSGVMTAGLAQKYLNIDGYLVGKKVFILGSGDIGLIMARRMKLEGADVLGVAELMPYSNGLQRNIAQCLNDFNIPLYLSHTVTNIKGKGRLEEIEISKVDENLNIIKGSCKIIKCDTLLLSVGLIPSNELLTNINCEVNKKTKGACVNESLETSIDGIFSCGNVLHVHDLVDNVTKEARRAGLSAASYIKDELINDSNKIMCINGTGLNYLLPTTINLSNIVKNIIFNFRVSMPYRDVSLNIYFNEKLIKQIKKAFMNPSEMETVILSKEILDKNTGKLEIRVEEK